MRLVDVVPADGVDRLELLRLAGAAEDASEHPIARAIAAGARDELGSLPPVERFTSRAGLGVEAVVGGRAIVVGRPALQAEPGLRRRWPKRAPRRRTRAARSSPSAGTARRAVSSSSQTA